MIRSRTFTVAVSYFAAPIFFTTAGVAFSARVAVNSPKNVLAAKKLIKTAFRYQVEGRGFSFIEALAACPTNWGMQPLAANERIGSEMIPYYPLGVCKNTDNL